MGWPIIASQVTIQPVQRNSRLHRTIDRVIQTKPDAPGMRAALLT
ncbi:hypothetical protein SAMN05443580_12821 [Variovorax sp. OV084]|nr:hypothetical protein SAMN05443580_12821 [Variovorax sp. OV084]